VCVIILGIEHDAQYIGLLEETNGFGHQARPYALTIERGMNSDTHQVAELTVQGVELIADDFAVQFRDDKIGVRCCYIRK